MRGSLRHIAVVVALIFSAIVSSAQTFEVNDSTEIFDPEEVLFEDFVKLPQVPKKQKPFIVEYMRNEAVKLAQLGYNVETMRGGEIVIVTIPTDNLFAPNDTTLMESAPGHLNNLLAYAAVPGRYKIIFKVHTDDTGSEIYLYNLSVSRMNSIYDFFDRYATSPDEVFGYPVGGEEPATDNSSRQNRAENRRLEIFILPGESLIEQAKKK